MPKLAKIFERSILDDQAAIKEKLLSELLARCATGEPITEICRELKISRNTVYAYFKRHGKPLRSKYIYQPFKLDKATRLKIAKEYINNNISASEIARRFNVNHKTITRCIRDCGFSVRSTEEKRQKNGHPCVNALIGDYKRHNSAKKYGFTLQYDEFYHLITSNCYYCGRPPEQVKQAGNNKFIRNGIDRINCKIGYHSDNVVACCKWCNFSKSTRTTKEFIEWILQLAKRCPKLLERLEYEIANPKRKQLGRLVYTGLIKKSKTINGTHLRTPIKIISRFTKSQKPG